jgi:hypothetical protein
MVVSIQIVVFWVVTPCSTMRYRGHSIREGIKIELRSKNINRFFMSRWWKPLTHSLKERKKKVLSKEKIVTSS